ncbi:zinc-ribbon domain-containing protein [bacterium]|nr:MAG: zinc-ribbon domain-containing protein [bacterium]
MIICPACGHQNIDGTQFCEMCGEELPDATAAATLGAGDVKCPNCGHLNPSDNLACEACGSSLQLSPSPLASGLEKTPFDDFATSVQTPPPPVASPTPVAPVVTADPFATSVAPDVTAPTATSQTPGDLKPGLVKLVVEQGQTVGAQFVLGDEQLEVGREDEDEDIYPDIDLSDQDAGYVHRRHATLNFDNGHLLVTHLGGANKTRVNNKPIPDNSPTEVKLGDKVSFGKVVLRLLPV